MKQIQVITEVSGEGLEALLGEQVLLMCMNFSYAGKLIGVNEKFVKLEDAGIVYETGPFTDSKWKDFQKIGQPVYVMIDKIESFFKGK